MKASTLVSGLALVAGLFLLTQPAAAQQVKKGTVSGTLLGVGGSGTGSMTVIGGAVTSSNFVIITQVCVGEGNDFVNTTTVPFVTTEQLAGCTTFDPGFAVPQGDEVRCNSSDGGGFQCSVVAVLSKR